jgi:NAD(P)-dependent dehydrogenase (short-subunit alcohol dehydrogenase family)
MSDKDGGTGKAAGRLAGRLALITGASRGLGRAVARRFADEGAHVILVARTQAALEELDDELRQAGCAGVTLVPGDLTESGLIERMAAAVYERWGALDVLVGNAGELGVLAPLGHIPPAVWDRVLALNVTVNWRLLRAFDPLLRASSAGRALFVTAEVSAGRAYWGAYAASKAALEAMVRSYAEEVGRTTRLRVNLICPAPLRTRLRATAFPGENPASVRAPDAATEAFVALAAADATANGTTLVV